MENEELEPSRRTIRRRNSRLAQDVLEACVDRDGVVRCEMLPSLLREARSLSGLTYSRVRNLAAGLTNAH